MNMTRNRISFFAGVLVASLALPVLADPPAGGSGVGGPPVGKESERGQEGFGKDGKGNRERARAGATERRSPEAWRRAFQSVESSLSDEQKTQIATIRSDFEAKTKAWKDANGAKERELQEKIRQSMSSGGQGDGKGERKGDGEGKGAGDAKPRGEGKQRPQVDPALIKEMQDLKSTMPKGEEMQKQLFAVLSADQQATFKTNYDNIEKELAAKKGERRRGEAGGDPMKDAPREGGDRPAKRPNTGKPFQFEEGKDAPPAQRNGDGKPSGS